MRRKLVDKSVRKIYNRSGSYAVTLPMEIIKELKWREKQKVIIKRRGRGIIIEDWKK